MYFQGQPVAKIDSNAVYFYHNDHLGTPMMVTDQNTKIVWQAEHLPFGEPQSITGTITNNLRFPGQYYDAETGLHYNYFRDYMPEIGRYIEKDPIGLEGGVNFYVYVDSVGKPLAETNLYLYTNNHPNNYVDPLGLIRWGTVITGALQTIEGLGLVTGGIGITIIAGVTHPGAGVAVGVFFGLPAVAVGGVEISHGIGTVAEGIKRPKPECP